jgi:hypothetical protein
MSWRGEFVWVVGLVALMGAEYWAIREPRPESVGAWLAAIVAFVAIERFTRRAPTPGPTARAHPNDPPLMRELLDALPLHVVQFFRHQDFLATFHMGDVRPLRDFVHRWDAPDHIFQDAELEEARRELVSAGAASSRLIAFKTRPLHGDLLTVKASSEDGDPYPDWVKNDAKEMDAAADKFVEAYDRMVTLGRQRLDISGLGSST